MALYLTPREVAARWACSARHVRRLCASGDLLAMRLGLESWRIGLAAVEAYEAAHSASASTVEPAPAPKEVTHTPSADGFTLPADYEPAFPDLWPGHEVSTNEKRPSAVTKRR